MAERREELRAADVDRAFVAERLKSALDEGRLSLSEYDERLQVTYAARTYGDLDKVLVDLPGHDRSQMVPGPPGASPVPAASLPSESMAAPRQRSVPRWLAAVWGAWLSAVLVNVAIWAAVSISSGHFIYFWPIWVAGPWGAVLLAGTITGILNGDGPQKHADAERRHAEEERRKAERRAERRARRAR